MANNYTFKDASASTQTVKSTDTASVHTPHVNVDTLPTLANVTTVGTVSTVSAVTSVTSVSLVSSLGGSSVAHDAADSGSPHKIGAKATTSLAGETMVASADRTDLRAGVDGVLITRPYCNLEDVVTGNASNTDGTNTSCIAAQGSGIKVHLTSISVTNTSSTDTYVEIKEATTARWTMSVPANGGAIVTFPTPLCPSSSNAAWNFDPGTAVTTMYCSMVGFKSKI